MTAIRIDNSIFRRGQLALAVLGVASILAMLATVITVNQTLAIFLSMIILTVYLFDRFAGMIAGVVLFAVKALFVRIAYSIDIGLGRSGFDLLGIAPALLLAALVGGVIITDYLGGRRLGRDKTRILMILFAGVSFLSIFNPANSPLVGLAGFERNIMPNMLVIFMAAALVTGEIEIDKLVKSLLVLGLVSTVYAIGQYLMVLYPWEMDWYRRIAFDQGLSGWLTIGLRGIEFRVFSIFYGYMDFFFTNVIIFGLALAFKDRLTGNWRKVRKLYFISWLAILSLSVERMPFIMSVIIILAYSFLRSSNIKRRKILIRGSLAVGVIYGILVFATPYLESTGAANLIRLAELANPFSAHSIDDRMENKWGPSLATINANPMGVGIGYGSQTKAKGQAEQGGFFVQPHNELIQKVLETGFIGGVIFLLLLIFTYRDFLAIRAFDNSGFCFGAGMAAITLSFWICGLVNLPFSGTSGLVYWTMAGAALGLKDNSVSYCNEPKQTSLDADKNGGRLMQDATIISTTANRDV
jgi:O-antigen ligase